MNSGEEKHDGAWTFIEAFGCNAASHNVKPVAGESHSTVLMKGTPCSRSQEVDLKPDT